MRQRAGSPTTGCDGTSWATRDSGRTRRTRWNAASSKAALEQFTTVAAKEFGGRGITVNCVSPGATDTDMFHAANPPEGRARSAALSALRRIGEPDDVAAVVTYLARPDAQWITGQNIRATGGLVI